MKRLLWLTIGFGLGVVLTVRATRVVRRTFERYVPDRTLRRLRAMDAAVEERRQVIRARKSAATVD